MALETGSGQATVSHKTIAAQGQARTHLTMTIFLGIVLVILAITFAYTAVKQIQVPGLLTLIGTIFGLAAGVISGRQSS
jgi:hypothetical protein